jgi:hypothetical protein
MNEGSIRLTLKPSVAEMVHQAVESGKYGTWEDIVAEALLEWRLTLPFEAVLAQTLTPP